MHVPDSREAAKAKRYFTPFLRLFQGKDKVLELGCGQGFFLEILRDAGIRYTGVEIDEGLCTGAVSRGLAPVVHSDIFSYVEGTEERFDACLASHIVEHFTPQEVSRLFQDLCRVIEPGGTLVVITPNIANLRRAAGDFWRDPTHVRPYPISALSKLLRSCGWEVVESGYHTDRPSSLRRTIVYGLRNLLIGKYWGKDDLYVVARRAASDS